MDIATRIITIRSVYLMPFVNGPVCTLDWVTFFSLGSFWKQFQSLRVSSPAVETTVVPSGERAIFNTLELWPRKQRIFPIPNSLL